jgi:hypothetical protein
MAKNLPTLMGRAAVASPLLGILAGVASARSEKVLATLDSTINANEFLALAGIALTAASIILAFAPSQVEALSASRKRIEIGDATDNDKASLRSELGLKFGESNEKIIEALERRRNDYSVAAKTFLQAFGILIAGVLFSIFVDAPSTSTATTSFDWLAEVFSAPVAAWDENLDWAKLIDVLGSYGLFVGGLFMTLAGGERLYRVVGGKLLWSAPQL